jgi:hypothetical protein
MKRPVIKRDTRLGPDAVVLLKVELWYELPVADYLDEGEESITIADIETAIGGPRRSYSQIESKALRGSLGEHDSGDVDFYVEVPDWTSRTYGVADTTWPVRIQNEYEAKRHDTDGELVGMDGRPC